MICNGILSVSYAEKENKRLISEYGKLAQNKYKTGLVWVEKVIQIVQET